MVGLLPDSRSLEGGSDSDYLVTLRYRLSARELPLIYADLRDAGCRAWQVQHGSDGPGRRIVRNCCCNRPNCLTCSPCSASSPTRPMKTASCFTQGITSAITVLSSGGFETAEARAWPFGRGARLERIRWGIEADGTIKGCPSLPTSAYPGGNIREKTLAGILASAPELNFNTGQGTAAAYEHLWGFCAGCDYAALCRGGCSWTAHLFFGPPRKQPLLLSSGRPASAGGHPGAAHSEAARAWNSLRSRPLCR